jgi:hypothetical protein
LPEIGARNHGGDDARDHDHGERTRREIAEDHFACEEHAADRRVERRRNAGGRAARDERPDDRRRRARGLAENGADRRADLHDRTLAPATAAEPDRRGRSERLDGDHARPDLAAVQRDGCHHFRDAVAARLGRESRGEPCGRSTAGRDDQHERESVRHGAREPR